MDTSSELVHSLLPVFMVSALGASMTAVGVVEGIAESTALIVKVFSGAISDRLGKRKLLTVIGYGVAALTKPLFPIAGSVGVVFAARFVDRIGKGIRGAPRDALVSEIAPAEIRGAAIGLRQSLDTVGAFLGPTLAMLGMWWLANDVRSVLWIAVVPGILSVLVLVIGVHEPPSNKHGERRTVVRMRDLAQVGRGYWRVVAIGGMLSLARFRAAFLLLRAAELGVATMFVPLVMVVMNIVYSMGAYPAGMASDRMSRTTIMKIGIALLVAADVVLGLTAGIWTLMLGVSLWGLHLALTQGQLTAMIADTTPTELRGSAYGMFHLVSGVMLLVASVAAGMLWDGFGASVMFGVGAVLAATTLLMPGK
ncbi:MAG: MFS transporter [Ignavibacteriae bacterium]|nr:MAG: MFS transporter [Ignavibacteriota bacterium]